MREIKFRGKRLDNNEWVYGYYAYHEDVLRHRETHGIYSDYADSMPESEGYSFYPDFYAVNPETVGQFTGLLDKNGKEIYEGDIVNIHEIPFELNHIGKVIFNEQIASFKVHIEENGRTYRMSFISSDTYNDGYCSVDIKYDFEVIGNIHDNPELMKGD